MKKKHIYLCLCLFWMGLIFWFSAQVGTTSQGMSNHILELLDSLFPAHSMQGSRVLETVSFLVRKAAHMIEYAVLAIFFVLYLKETEKRNYILMAFIGVFLYACSDEFHQVFVQGRSGQWRDVGIDMLGGSIALLVYQIYQKKRRHNT